MSPMLKWCLCLTLCYYLNATFVYSSSYNRSLSSEQCIDEERVALLGFKSSFTLESEFDDCPYARSKTSSWNKDVDCCEWEGVVCHPQTHHVVSLDLSCSKLSGTIASNSSLFLLTHLKSLNLAFNHFNYSNIAPQFGKFPMLEHLNLSNSSFTGKIPAQIAHLAQLNSLDLTGNSVDLELPIFNKIIDNMTELRELHLSNVYINSALPHSIVNLTSLRSLKLDATNLQGELPMKIFNLPHLRVLDIDNNWPLQSSSLETYNWSSPFEVMDLSGVTFKGQLPTSLSQFHHLRELSFSDCSFEGEIPRWVWNATEMIDLHENHFRGNLPSSINTSKLSSLYYLSLDSNLLEGRIPPWMFTLQSLKTLSLVTNQFTSLPSEVDINNSNESQLQELYLGGNKLEGSLPQWISQLVNLEQFDITSNNLSGMVQLGMLTSLPKLQFLSLGYNKLSVNTNISSTTAWPNLTYLDLSSCNTGEFPSFLKDQLKLEALFLSKNNIHGDVPKWLQNLVVISEIDLSHNLLSGGLEHLPWYNLQVIDLSFNTLKGPLPIPKTSSTISSFSASDNSFIGPIDESICSLIYLYQLDVSNNRLEGEIPRCLGNFRNSLTVLNLGSNNFHGTLPANWGRTCDDDSDEFALKYLDFSDNKLQGLLPRYLARCKSLEFFSVANNKFNDTFPSWLETLPNLQVLDLHSNSFHGHVKGSKVAHPFPLVQILDLSSNKFSGRLPKTYIKNFKAMMNTSDSSRVLSYMGAMGSIFYEYSIVIAFNGLQTKYEKIITSLVAFDLSSNAFEGEIPDCIGQLILIRGLNLSHNRLTGPIPPTISNLKLLDSLDLSFNRLIGEIPNELVSLTFLGVFNVSMNSLVGPIPHGNNFDTFPAESYMGNPGLCGLPLPECGEDNKPRLGPSVSDTNDDDDIEEGSMLSEWKVILLGYGFGTVVGMAWGYYMLSIGKPIWLARIAHRMELATIQLSEKLFGRRARRARN